MSDISIVQDIDSVIQACLMAIHCRQGKFYPDKNYGSTISDCELNNIIAGARYAVRNFDGVVIKGGALIDGRVHLDILINDEERSVTV